MHLTDLESSIIVGRADNLFMEVVAERHFLGWHATTYLIWTRPNTTPLGTALVTIEHTDISISNDLDGIARDRIWYCGAKVPYDIGAVAATIIQIIARQGGIHAHYMAEPFNKELAEDDYSAGAVLGGFYNPIRRMNLANLINSSWGYGKEAIKKLYREAFNFEERIFKAATADAVLKACGGEFQGKLYSYNQGGTHHRLPVAPGRYLDVQFGDTQLYKFDFPCLPLTENSPVRPVFVFGLLEVNISTLRKMNQQDFNAAWAFVEYLRSNCFRVDAQFSVREKVGGLTQWVLASSYQGRKSYPDFLIKRALVDVGRNQFNHLLADMPE